MDINLMDLSKNELVNIAKSELDKRRLPWDIEPNLYEALRIRNLRLRDYNLKISFEEYSEAVRRLFLDKDTKYIGWTYGILTDFFDLSSIYVKYFRFMVHFNSFVSSETECFEELFESLRWIIELYDDLLVTDSFANVPEKELMSLLGVLCNNVLSGEYRSAYSCLKELMEKYPSYKKCLLLFSSLYGEKLQKWAKDKKEEKLFFLHEQIRTNHKDYSAYLSMADLYQDENLLLTYLCLENAMYHCDVPEVKEDISLTMEELKKIGCYVPPTSIVILSYNTMQLTKDCIESIRKTTPESAREIVIVDNASSDNSVDYLRGKKDIVLIESKENLGFPGGCNVGINNSKAGNDIWLLNSDTILSENALFWLRMCLYSNEKIGAAGSTANYVSNGQQRNGYEKDVEWLLRYGHHRNSTYRKKYELKTYLVGFSVLVKRKVVDEVGLLDERFYPGNFEDTDWGLRILQKGYNNVVCENSNIVHLGSQSFGKMPKQFNDLLAKNEGKFNEKWNMNSSRDYLYPNIMLANIIDAFYQADKNKRMVVIGHNILATAAMINHFEQELSILPIEIDDKLQQFADGMNALTLSIDNTDELAKMESFGADLIICNCCNPEVVNAISRMGYSFTMIQENGDEQIYGYFEKN